MASLKKTSNIDYLNKDELLGIKAEQIKESLTRSAILKPSNSFETGSIKVEAQLMTSAYITTYEKEEGARLLESKESIQKKISEMKFSLTDKKKCFLITVQTPQPIDIAKFTNFTAKRSASFLILSGEIKTPKYSRNSETNISGFLCLSPS